jgi:hypothetical protein
MYAQVDHALRRAYAVPDIYLVWVNIALAGFVTLSHGGALLVALSKDSPQLDEIRALAMLSLPLCALVLVSAVAGLLHRGWMRRVLMVHSGVVVLSAVVLILWSLKLLFMGIPEERFVWMVGMLTAWVTYAAVLAVRVLFANWSSAYYMPAFALLFAAVVDIGVLTRAL